ncbi:phage tail termination protein [Streptomyces anulatus]
MWADVELLVMTGLRPLLPGVRVVDELPDRLETRVPLVSVLVVGGDDDRITDTATVDLASFAATRAEAWALAEQSRRAMHSLAATHNPGQRAVIDDVTTSQRPAIVPYGNPAVRRALATYTVSARTRAAT